MRESNYSLVYSKIANGELLGTNTSFTQIKDLNGDGLEDIVNFGAVYPPNGPGTAPLRVAYQNANGTFTVVNPMADGSDLLTTHPRYVEFQDFNGDGIVDIFIAAHGYDTSPYVGEQNRLLLGTANGKFVDATANLPQLTDFSHGLAVGDIDRDGDLDIYVGNVFGQGRIAPYLLLNDGKGKFTIDRSSLPTSIVTGLDTGKQYTTADFEDIDKDGYLDLILGGEKVPSVIFWGNASGKFSDQVSTTLPTPSYASAPIFHDILKYDFNGDGRMDLLMISISDLFKPGGIQLLLNDGARGFTDATKQFFSGVTTTAGEIYEIRMLDVNKDGALDLVRSDLVYGSNPNDPLIWLNDGQNHFTSLTMSDLGFGSSDLIQDVYIGPGGEIRFLSALGTFNGSGFANFYRPSGAPFTIATDGSGNDTILDTTGNDAVDGKAGRDTFVYTAPRQNFTVKVQGDGSLTVTGSGTDQLLSIERLKFTDGTLAFDFVGDAGQAYRIYQAAFGRTPDTSGLSYWVKSMDGGTSLQKVAEGFLASNEFTSLYGSNVSNREFVQKLYQNVLHRAGEDGGVTFWTGQLDTGTSKAAVLIGFSESAENIAGVGPAISDGIWLI